MSSSLWGGELRKVSAPLLKSLQTEIDQLLRRFKYAETAFLNVYKKVIDLPDPVEVLEHVQQLQRRAQRSSELELENNQLRDTLNEYNNEFAQVKNQEVTIKSLKEKVRSLEEEMESKVCNQLKERERQLERSFAEKEREIQDSNLDVARRLGEAERTIETLRSALSQAQSELFDVKSKYDERANAKLVPYSI
ncbi:DgyrCDS9284 [Dimorphilus gyrociliatus]|uniref:DgyrCDS9284 n=1 Tax=Dimorphilus gyrociliatus TaxID=2664684 RepID=A0A7I8VZ70_9ANNE|nr:DgyrCDS9284 [Dimorphilus gyrociliatus]